MSILDGVQKVLGLYAQGNHEMSFTDVAARLGLPRSSASRLLNQMLHYGLLEQDLVTRRYRPGLLLQQAVQGGVASTPLDDLCREVLASLCERSGLTAYLSTLNNRETVVLQRLNGSHPVQVLSSPGSRRAASSTAMGQALLSRLTPAEFELLYGADSGMALDAAGPSSLGELISRVDQARNARMAVAIHEAMPGIGAVAAAVRDPQTHEVRGLCVSFVAYDVTEADVARWRDLVLEEVGALGRRLNDSFWLHEG